MYSPTNGYRPGSLADPRSQLKSGSIDPLIGQIKEKWKKCWGKGDSFKKDLHDDVVSDLYRPIKEALETAIKGGQEQCSNVVLGTKVFLKDEMKQYQIDDCILWLILYKAVSSTSLSDAEETMENAVEKEAAEENINSERNVNILITRIIIEVAPHLAFDNPYRPSELALAWKTHNIKKRCKYSSIHCQHKADMKTTPFHKAAANGNGKAVKHMIYRGALLAADGSGKPLPRDLLLQVLRLPNTDPQSKMTALWLAATAEEGDLRALKALLDFDTGIADPSDGTFEDALKKGRGDVIDAFLQFEKLRMVFITSSYIIQAMDPLSDAQLNITARQHRVDVVKTLIKHATTSDVINDEVVEKIIQLNLKDVWAMRSPNIKLNTSGLLHLAVQHQNADFVEMFLRDYPDSITEKKKDTTENKNDTYYPLWHNNKILKNLEWRDRKLKEFPEKDKIRDMIVTATIKNKKINKMQDLLQIFQDSGQVVNELCFDLSRFNSKVYPVSDFVRSLIAHQDNADLLSYEHTIKYAEFPALDLKVDEKETFGDSVDVEHTEVFEVLNWLKGKKVNEIIELIVPDRLVNPHNEVEIGKYVKKFEVEFLNWRFLDMSISIFEDLKTRERIRELHLYSSGKRAVISHWLSKQGVSSLPNLTTLEIYVIQELMTKENCHKTVAFMRAKFDALSDEINEARKRENREELKVNVSPQLWNPTHERVADLEEIAERAVPKLSRFIKSYHDYVHDVIKQNPDTFRPTKVAIIDNGILTISPRTSNHWDLLNAHHRLDGPHGISVSEIEHMKQQQQGPDIPNGDGKLPNLKVAKKYKTLWSRIKGGRSFVDDNSRVSPWLFASDPHGTQMANLICAIDPWCELYVAKVTESRYGITPERVARAIRWAIHEQVDIISMSFAIMDNTDRFRDACEAAAKKGIIMLCSTHDEGSNIDKAWPAAFNDTITITACDEFGVLLRTTKQNYDYAIRGLEVAAGVVPFLKSDDRISGSSVSTAIAAGLSSLTLSCDRLARPGKRYGRDDRSKVIEHHLKEMRAAEKYILLEKFAGIDQKIKDGRDINAQQILEDVFETAQYK